MNTLNISLKRAFLALTLVFASQSAAAYNNIPVNRNDDEIREFDSYDPKDDKWNRPDAFRNVDIIDRTEKRKKDYIYRGFWAYDPVKGRWHKIDVPNYFYKLDKPLATTAKRSRSYFGFLRNLNFGLKGAGGSMFHTIRIGESSLTSDRNKSESYILQTKSQEEAGKGGYTLHWPGEPYAKVTHDYTPPKDAGSVKRGKKIALQGQDFSVPLTLFGHYTFFKRVRLGGGATAELHHLKKLSPKEDAFGVLSEYEVPLKDENFYSLGFFGLLGFNVIHWTNQDLFLDIRVGQHNIIGSNLGKWWNELLDGRSETYYVSPNGLLIGADVSFEHKLNNYFTGLLHIGGSWMNYDDTPEKMRQSDPDAFIDLHQIGIHAGVGIQFRLRKDAEEERNKEAVQKNAEEREKKLRKAGKTLKGVEQQRENIEDKLKWQLR